MKLRKSDKMFLFRQVGEGEGEGGMGGGREGGGRGQNPPEEVSNTTEKKFPN
jgi:hypothetical protein